MNDWTSTLAAYQLLKSQAYAYQQYQQTTGPFFPNASKATDWNWGTERKTTSFDFYAVLDFECTCERNARSFQHEIIEFPVVFLNARTLEVEMEFRRYVRPTEKPGLSKFCTELTGIDQGSVDTADTLDVVLLEFDRFLRDHGLTTMKSESADQARLRSFVIATDGPWDVLSFLRKECQRKGLPLQTYWDYFVDVRRQYAAWYNVRRCGIRKMLAQCGLEFQGREHSGIDDARNIARIAAEMIKTGCPMTSDSWKNNSNDVEVIY
jgi:3'-5' exoribonuclease 1